MLTRPFATVLAVFVLAAGCIGGSDAPSETASVAETAASPPTAAGANATMDLEDEATVPADLSFSYSGSTPEGVCGPVGCEFVTAGSEDFHIVEHGGHPTSLTVTVTYADVKPGMEFYIGLCQGAGESEADVSCADYTTGASPLTVTFDLADHVPGNQIALSTGALNGASTATGIVVFTSSSFDVAGTLSFSGSH